MIFKKLEPSKTVEDVHDMICDSSVKNKKRGAK
jgi:hypothetical protein